MSAAQRKRAKGFVNTSCLLQNYDDVPVLTIPVINDEEELEMAINSISQNVDAEGIPDNFILGCSLGTIDNISGIDFQEISHTTTQIVEAVIHSPPKKNKTTPSAVIVVDSVQQLNNNVDLEEISIDVIQETENIYFIDTEKTIESPTQQSYANETQENSIHEIQQSPRKEIIQQHPRNEIQQSPTKENPINETHDTTEERQQNITNESQHDPTEQRRQSITNETQQVSTQNIETQTNSTASCDESTNNNSTVNQDLEDIDSIATEQVNKRPKRGRKRKTEDQNREIRKKRANTNKDYINAKGKEVKSKTFTFNNFDCHCPKKCAEKLSADQRKAEFDKFWSAGSYEARCALLQGYVKEYAKKRSYSIESKRMYTRKYCIQNVDVCKKTLLNTLAISQARVDNALMKNRNNEPINDKRGIKSGGQNSITPEQLKDMRDFIEQLPRYSSHYCRQSTNTNYLAPNLNLTILYDKIYKDTRSNPVSFSRFRQCFIQDFNLKFKKPQKDTCLRCDTYKAKLTGVTGAEKNILEKQHLEHVDHARALREQMKKDLALAKTEQYTETLTFDLEKTHSLPKLPTNVVYYKRQLNLYNLGIHCGSTGQGFFYVWLEHQAGRGTQEVGSCIRKFIKDNLKPGVKRLILWSDSCGGQNRSIKMVLVLLHILQNHPTLEEVFFRFLQPGHTYLPNDSEFGDVECLLKKQTRLYTADDLIEVMKNCRRRNKFIVIEMAKEDFYSISTIENQITNRKLDKNKNKISWMNTFEINLKKNEATTLYMKSKLDKEPKTVDISKGGKGRKKQIDFEMNLPLLYPEGRELSSAKIKDLKEMLKLIPADAKPFYNFLRTIRSGAFVDDVDGFGSTIDFEIEEDNEEVETEQS